jgi:hypothetical protein
VWVAVTRGVMTPESASRPVYESPRSEMATNIFGARAPPPTPTDHHTRHLEFRGVQFAPRGFVINVPNNLSTQIDEEIHMSIRTTVIGAWSVLGAADCPLGTGHSPGFKSAI